MIWGRQASHYHGDAFLDFLKIHGIRDSVSDAELKSIMKRFISEMEYHKGGRGVEVQKLLASNRNPAFGKLTHRMRSEN